MAEGLANVRSWMFLPRKAITRASTGSKRMSVCSICRFSAVTHHARPARSDHESRVIRLMLPCGKFQLEIAQENRPYHFDLLISESGADTTMLAASETDQR